MSPKIVPESTLTIKNQNNIGLIILFLLVAIVGLFYVKWSPYYAKAFLAASKHSIGASIVTGKSNAAPTASLAAAFAYSAAYFKVVWKAALLGLLLGSLIQVTIPRNWIKKAMGTKGLGSTATAGAVALPGMMCSCCAAPVTVGLRKSSASPNAALAFFLGNPTLNPATIVFMGFVLGWNFAIFRIVMGLILVFGISTLASKFLNDESVDRSEVISKMESTEESDSVLVRWIKAFIQLSIDTIPAYLIAVTLLGGVRAWLFPAVGPTWGNSIIAILLLAITGTLFVIPTAAEIPIIQTLLTFGLGAGPAAALLLTLPSVSLPSLLLIRRVFPTRVLVFTGVSVAVLGIISGFIGMLVL